MRHGRIQDTAIRSLTVWQNLIWPKDNLQTLVPACAGEQFRARLLAHIRAHFFKNPGDIARDRARQPSRDRVPVTVEEDPGRDDLQQYERGNDDH